MSRNELMKTPNRKQRIQKASLHDHVVDALRHMIVTGDLKAGERIVEKELSETLGVSRTPIREAIKTLTLDGLVDSPVHHGARVKPLEPREMKELFDVIAVIEALAAEITATTITDRDLKKLETKHNRMKRHFDAADRDAYFQINTDIHETIVDLSGNEIIALTHKRLMLRASRGRYLAILEGSRWKDAMNEHDILMEALRARDPGAAFNIWRLHLVKSGEAVLRGLKQMAETSEE